MIVDFNALSDFSKVFIFPSNRKFYKDELPKIDDKVQKFLKTFHQIDFSYEIKYQRFIVVFISESTPLGIDEQDKLIDFVIDLEKEFNISLLDKINVCFKQGEHVQQKEISAFKKLIKNRSVSKKTIVFDNFIQSKVEFEQYWEMPAASSWVSYLF